MATDQSDGRLFLQSAPSLSTVETFAVAVLDDGSEVRMRNCGDHVEVRTWDKTGSCNPPPLAVTRVGAHVVDLTLASNPYLPEKPADGKHVFRNGSYRCSLCGVYNRTDSPPFHEPCEGGWAESGKMRAAAERQWAADRAEQGGSSG